MLYRVDFIQSAVHRAHVDDDWTPPVLVRRQHGPLPLQHLHSRVADNFDFLCIGDANLHGHRCEDPLDPDHIRARFRRSVGCSVHLLTYQHVD